MGIYIMHNYRDLTKYKNYCRCNRYIQLGITYNELDLALKNDFIQWEFNFRGEDALSIACIRIVEELRAGMLLYQLVKQFTIPNNPLNTILGKKCTIYSIEGDSWVSYTEFKDICEKTIYLKDDDNDDDNDDDDNDDKHNAAESISWLELMYKYLIVQVFYNEDLREPKYIRPDWTIFVLLLQEVANTFVIDYVYIRDCMRENFKQIREMNRKPLTLAQKPSILILGEG